MLSVRINGSVLGPGALWPLHGGPFASLIWLRRHLAEFQLALIPGQIVVLHPQTEWSQQQVLPG
jgi:hypothetical protein